MGAKPWVNSRAGDDTGAVAEPITLIKGGWTNMMTHISVYLNNFFSAFICVVSILTEK